MNDCFRSLDEARTFQESASQEYPYLKPNGVEQIDQAMYRARFFLSPFGLPVYVYNQTDLANAIHLALQGADAAREVVA